MRASVLSRRNWVHLLHSRRAVALFFAIAISLSLFKEKLKSIQEAVAKFGRLEKPWLRATDL